jgi:hypothetical protein
MSFVLQLNCVLGIDVGCGELIASGRIRIKSGVEVKRFTGNTIIFSDNSEIDADVVIFASVGASFSDDNLLLIVFAVPDMKTYAKK